MFADRFSHAQLEAWVLPRAEYRPFPAVADRQGWASLPEELHAFGLVQGEQRLGFTWPVLPASRYMDYARDGNRSRYEGLYFERRSALGALALAECLRGDGRFIDAIIDGIWCICDEATWVVPAHNYNRQALAVADDGNIDLFAAETGALLAWTYYLLRERLDAVAPIITERMQRLVTARIFDPYLTHTDFWWMGLAGNRVNNWTPWIVSNVLATCATVETDQQRRVAVVEKSLPILDRFIDAYGPDGGCDEGPGYWSRAGGSLFDCLEILHSLTGGQLDLFADPLVGEIGRYMIRAHIDNTYFINFADGGAKVHASAELLWRYGQRIGDVPLRALGAYLFRLYNRSFSSGWTSQWRGLQGIFHFAEMAAEDAPYAPRRDAWLPDVQIMVAREQDAVQGLYLATKGGHNAESHNHNDVGHFIVYCDGRPVLVDAGVEAYTAKTFSAQRYEIWTMQSAYHNLPTVNGVQQVAGHEFAAREVAYAADDAAATFTLDIAGAYPPEAGITRWMRTCRLQRAGAVMVEISDDFTLNNPADVTLSLLTPCQVSIEPGLLTLHESVAGDLHLAFAPALFTAVVEPINTDDRNMNATWDNTLQRILLRATGKVASGQWTLRITKGA